jgi:hypothetical protein
VNDDFDFVYDCFRIIVLMWKAPRLEIKTLSMAMPETMRTAPTALPRDETGTT